MGNTMLFLRHNIYVHCIHRILAHNFFGKLGVQLNSLDSCMKGGGSNIFIVIIVLCIYTYPAARGILDSNFSRKIIQKLFALFRTEIVLSSWF